MLLVLVADITILVKQAVEFPFVHFLHNCVFFIVSRTGNKVQRLIRMLEAEIDE